MKLEYISSVNIKYVRKFIVFSKEGEVDRGGGLDIVLC